MHRCPPRPRRRPWLALAAAAATLTTAACDKPQAQSATAPGQWRTFDGTWNASGSHTTIPLGPDSNRKAATLNLSGTMLLTGEGRPGVGFRAQVIALVDSQTGLAGRGVWTDENGDQVFSELKGEGTKENNRIEGTLIGGTGRYADATGTYEFTWQSVIETDDSTIQGRAVNFKGRYQIGKPTIGGHP